MNMELKVRTNKFREYMGASANGLSDAKLRRLAGWFSFNSGWDAAIESTRPIKSEPLSKRTTAA